MKTLIICLLCFPSLSAGFEMCFAQVEGWSKEAKAEPRRMHQKVNFVGCRSTQVAALDDSSPSLPLLPFVKFESFQSVYLGNE